MCAYISTEERRIYHEVYSVYSRGSRDKRFLFSLSFTRLFKISIISIIFIVRKKMHIILGKKGLQSTTPAFYHQKGIGFCKLALNLQKRRLQILYKVHLRNHIKKKIFQEISSPPPKVQHLLFAIYILRIPLNTEL